MRTCHNCQSKDFTVSRRRVEFDGIGYTDALCVTCWIDANRAFALASHTATQVGTGR